VSVEGLNSTAEYEEYCDAYDFKECILVPFVWSVKCYKSAWDKNKCELTIWINSDEYVFKDIGGTLVCDLSTIRRKTPKVMALSVATVDENERLFSKQEEKGAKKALEAKSLAKMIRHHLIQDCDVSVHHTHTCVMLHRAF
jgi:hypothetical protein